MLFLRTAARVVALIAFIAVSACAPRPSASAVAAVSAVPTVQKSAPFAAVAASFRAGAYADALAEVRAMETRADLSPADRAYLDKQAAICQAKLSPVVASHPISSAPAALGAPAAANASDCGPRALFFVCRENHVPATLATLTSAAGTKPGVGTSMAGLAKAASGAGFAPAGVQVDADALKRIHPPAIAWVGGDHYVAVTAINGGFNQDLATVYDPATGGKSDIAETDLLKASGGVLLLLPRKNVSDYPKGNP